MLLLSAWAMSNQIDWRTSQIKINLFQIFYHQIHHVLSYSNFHMDTVKRLAYCFSYLDMSLNWFHLLRANLALLSLMAVPRSNTRTSS